MKRKPGDKLAPSCVAKGYIGAYQPEQLRYMLEEHLLEHMTAVDLGKALGINKGTAMLLKRDPSQFVDTDFEWNDAAIIRVRKYLEAQG